jgi:hypothetical protein
MRNSHGGNWNTARNTEKHGKRETNILGPEMKEERVKNLKNEKWTL